MNNDSWKILDQAKDWRGAMTISNHLPDGSERFLVDEAMLLRVSASLGAEFIEPIKTTGVQNMRSMTTWCLKKE